MPRIEKRKIPRTSLPSSLHHRRCFAKRTLDELQGTETADLTRQKGKKLQKTHIWGQEQEKEKGKFQLIQMPLSSTTLYYHDKPPSVPFLQTVVVITYLLIP